MNLLDAQVGKPYVIAEIRTSDPDMDSFLFRLGAYSGETISIVSKKRKACIVVIKNGRYSLDNLLAEAIVVTEE